MRVIETSPDNALGNKLKLGLALSVLIHLALLSALTLRPDSSFNQQRFIEVSIIPPPADIKTINSTQTVSEPESPESEQEVDSRLLAERNRLAEKEQIKRGQPMSAPDAGQSSATEPSPELKAPRRASETVERSKPVEKKPGKQAQNQGARPLSNLRLDNQTLMQKFSQPETEESSPELTKTRPSEYQAFSRPQGSGAAFIGTAGSPDYLPDLPDGDITLLNTKANQYAVFVRRVATLVFSHMRSTGWETLLASDINRIGDFCTVRAILNKEGKLERVIIESASGSKRFDDTLALAVRKGASDPNPPQSALSEDGKFHFIFKSKSWSQMANNRRTGAPFERRWLLLATGLL